MKYTLISAALIVILGLLPLYIYENNRLNKQKIYNSEEARIERIKAANITPEQRQMLINSLIDKYVKSNPDSKYNSELVKHKKIVKPNKSIEMNIECPVKSSHEITIEHINYLYDISNNMRKANRRLKDAIDSKRYDDALEELRSIEKYRQMIDRRLNTLSN